MDVLILFLLLQTKPLKIFTQTPPLAISCAKGTAAVRYDKENVEKVGCYEHLQCDDGTAYGSGACVCKPGMPLLDQDGVVNGCTAKAPPDKKSGE